MGKIQSPLYLTKPLRQRHSSTAAIGFGVESSQLGSLNLAKTYSSFAFLHFTAIKII